MPRRTVDEQDRSAEAFEERRARLRTVAFRMLGSLSEADDAIQEAWLRLSRSDAHLIENLERRRRARSSHCCTGTAQRRAPEEGRPG